MDGIAEHLNVLYGDAVGQAVSRRLEILINKYRAQIPLRVADLTERDAILITYGDQVSEPNIPPLATLGNFCAQHLTGVISGIHILPFYPFTSDDGFSVVDYRAVNPALGTWDDVAQIGTHFRLMFDAVINHISARSNWFQGFLHDDPHYRDYFIVVPEGVDLSQVVRPRTLPLLTEFETPSGKKNVWTTFSADQVDLNYRNPELLLEVLEALLFYVAHGAEFIRLDAIAFLWKEFGTPCLHLPQTHCVIQLIRAVMDAVAPQVMLITETNVPHVENMSYFGAGTNEAQMIYNFALPPLTLHAFRTEDATTLSRWASELTLPSKRATFFNFLASHDGIGLNPARGILSEAEINALVMQAQAHGGLVSYKTDPDGSPSPYELNLNYFDALSDPQAHESLDVQIDRFVCAHAIMLAFIGVPGIYFHSLFGSRSWRAGVAQTGHYRTINREKSSRGALEQELRDTGSLSQQVLARFKRLLQIRRTHAAFDPYSAMRVVDMGESIFALVRGELSSTVLCLHNVSAREQPIKIDLAQTLGTPYVTDLLTGQSFDTTQVRGLLPYQLLWFVPQSK